MSQTKKPEQADQVRPAYRTVFDHTGRVVGVQILNPEILAPNANDPDIPADFREYYRRMELAMQTCGVLPPYPTARPDEIVESEYKDATASEPKLLLEVTRQDVLALEHNYDKACQMAFVNHGITEAHGLYLLKKFEYWHSILQKLPPNVDG